MISEQSSMNKQLLRESEEAIREALKYGKGIVAYSGGKDGTVAADIVNSISPNIPMVCETSFYFPEQLDNIKEIALNLGLNVTYKSNLTDEWLLKNKHFIFSDDAKIRSKSFSLRQQKSIKLFAKERGAKVTFTGRRTEENTVKKIIYDTAKNGIQCHPLRNWRTSDIWDYFKYRGIKKPIIYNTPFGQKEGNAPFYSLNKKDFNGDLEKCWDIIRLSSNRQNFDIKFK